MDDDIYEGFGSPSIPDNTSLVRNISTGRIGTALNPVLSGDRPGTAFSSRVATAARLGTASQANQPDGPRPLTSVKGAGYQSRATTANRMGASTGGNEVHSSGSGIPMIPFKCSVNQGPDGQVREMEARVHSLLESSAIAASNNDFVLALERAKEAGRRERALAKFRESNNLLESANTDLTYAVCLNLARAFGLNKMYNEATNAYNMLIRDKQFPRAQRLRIHVGNLYFEQMQYPAALKQYKMALDTMPTNDTISIAKVHRNIGIALARLGKWIESANAFELSFETHKTIEAAFNLLLCCYASGNVTRMQCTFRKMLELPLPHPDAENHLHHSNETWDTSSGLDKTEYGAPTSPTQLSSTGGPGSPMQGPVLNSEGFVTRDKLLELLEKEQKTHYGYIITAGRIIAPVIDPNDWKNGYKWVIDLLNVDFPQCASELQIACAIEHMKHQEFAQAIETLKTFERKEPRFQARAANNLSFLYFLEGDLTQASKYSAIAVKHDRYNARALVNMGNSLAESDADLERAKELYLEAIGVEADCLEAIYNLGLVNKQLGSIGESIQAFEKLYTLSPTSPETLYHLSLLHSATGNYQAAEKYASLLVSVQPKDPGALMRLGKICHKLGDDTQAYHYSMESYQLWPMNLEVISWLGIWFVQAELYNRAAEFFERAYDLQPNEVKWSLMVASCHRRLGNLATALKVYESIHQQYPSNVEALKYLITISREMGKKYSHYEERLLRLEAINENFETNRMTSYDPSLNAQYPRDTISEQGYEFGSDQMSSFPAEMSYEPKYPIRRALDYRDSSPGYPDSSYTQSRYAADKASSVYEGGVSDSPANIYDPRYEGSIGAATAGGSVQPDEYMYGMGPNIYATGDAGYDRMGSGGGASSKLGHGDAGVAQDVDVNYSYVLNPKLDNVQSRSGANRPNKTGAASTNVKRRDPLQDAQVLENEAHSAFAMPKPAFSTSRPTIEGKSHRDEVDFVDADLDNLLAE